MRVLVTGAAGMLGLDVRRAGERAGHELVGLARSELDVTDVTAVGGVFARVRPDAVLNCAAWTDVDGAESNREQAHAVNADGAGNLARAAAAAGVPLLHVSTDYVFDGEKGAPYVETDPLGPLNIYGRAKADGEAALEALAAEGARVATLRTCWVFSDARTGFVGAMVRRAAEHDEAVVVADQWGSPTPAGACAEAALAVTRALLDREPAARGIFHAAGGDGLARADLAEAIFQRLPRRPRLRRIAAADYPTPARRPRDTRLSSAKLERVLGWRAPPLGESLDACLLGVEASAR